MTCESSLQNQANRMVQKIFEGGGCRRLQGKKVEGRRSGYFCQASAEFARRIGSLFSAAVQLIAALYVTTL